VGIVTLAATILFDWLIDFKYAIGHEWMVALSSTLTIPCAYFGGRACMARHSKYQKAD
jgi:hypothetical protein